MTSRIIICLDGTGPEYLAQSRIPNLDALGREGFRTIGKAVFPTVTNVNNTSIATASYPETHGITSNFYMDEANPKGVYMETPEFLLTRTVFRRMAEKGRTSVLLTAKDKLKTLLQDGACFSSSAEKPPRCLVERIGSPPGIYTIEVNHWLFEAGRVVLEEMRPDLLYISTTDFVTHKYGPEHELAQWNFNRLDSMLGKILNVSSDIEVVVTADHGMNEKHLALDLGRILGSAGIMATVIPIIKDRHEVHHQNLSGSAYVYLNDPAAGKEARALLMEEPGIEDVLEKEETAARFHLHPERIGHLMVLGDKDTVFGILDVHRKAIAIRSHGSLHEQPVPIIGKGAGPLGILPDSNHRVAAWIV